MNRGFALSVALHASLFVLILLGPGPSKFEWEPADAIAVELVAMVPEPPVEKPAPPTPRIDPTPAPVVKEADPEPVKEVKPPEPAPVKKATPKPKPRRVYRQFAPKHDEDEPSLEERLRQRLTEVAAQALPGTVASAPEAPSPASSRSTEVEAADFPYAWYLNVLQNKITDAWDPPGTRMIDTAHNRVLLRFRIHRDGRVTDVRVEGGSGTPGLDASAHRAVDRARPFPPLPESYEGDELDVGVRFTVSGSGS